MPFNSPQQQPETALGPSPEKSGATHPHRPATAALNPIKENPIKEEENSKAGTWPPVAFVPNTQRPLRPEGDHQLPHGARRD